MEEDDDEEEPTLNPYRPKAHDLEPMEMYKQLVELDTWTYEDKERAIDCANRLARMKGQQYHDRARDLDQRVYRFEHYKPNPVGAFTEKGERMYEEVKASYGRDPRAKEIAARTVYARAKEGASGLIKKGSRPPGVPKSNPGLGWTGPKPAKCEVCDKGKAEFLIKDRCGSDLHWECKDCLHPQYTKIGKHTYRDSQLQCDDCMYDEGPI